MSILNRIVPSAVSNASTGSNVPLTRYVDFAINNPSGDRNKTATFEHTYNGDILPKASDYLVAPMSFKIPVQDLPLFIMPIVPNQANANLSSIVVRVTHNKSPASIAAGTITTVTSYPVSLVWEPQTMGIPAPTQNVATQRVTPYYYMYSFEHYVNMVNTAITASYVAAGSPGATTAPKFVYDEALNIFRWELATAFTTDTSGGVTYGWTVSWNKAFDDLLPNFNVIENGYDEYILESTKSALSHTASGVITLYQDNTTTENFNSVERILAITTLPLTQDFFPSGDGVPQGLSAKQQVLADVIPDFDNNLGKLRSPIVYNPNNLEWSDMTSPLPLRTVSVRFVWIDTNNVAHDIYVPQGQNIPVRLTFRHKYLATF